MKKRLLNISLIALPILFILSLFEVINVESYYEDQSFVNAPVDYLRSLKNTAHLLEILTAAIVVLFIVAIYIDNKKGKVSKTPPQL